MHTNPHTSKYHDICRVQVEKWQSYDMCFVISSTLPGAQREKQRWWAGVNGLSWLCATEEMYFTLLHQMVFLVLSYPPQYKLYLTFRWTVNCIICGLHVQLSNAFSKIIRANIVTARYSTSSNPCSSGGLSMLMHSFSISCSGTNFQVSDPLCASGTLETWIVSGRLLFLRNALYNL